MNKSRLEAFTDAMIAIAATIMVLELHSPDGVKLSNLLSEWHVLFAYIVSFFLIYLFWFSHHNTFKNAEIISNKVFLLNGIWLFLLTLVPFTTSWISEKPNATLPMITYLLLQIFWVESFFVLNKQVCRDNPDMENTLPRTNKLVKNFYGCFALAFVFAFFIPIVSLVIVGLVNINSFRGILSVKNG